MESFVKMGGHIGRDIRVWWDMAANYNLDEEARKDLEFVGKGLN